MQSRNKKKESHPPMRGRSRGSLVQLVINRLDCSLFEKNLFSLFFSQRECLTTAESSYTFTHGEGKSIGTFFPQMIPNKLFNHQELA